MESKDKAAEKEHVDPIIKALGKDLGRFQLVICLLVFMSKFPSGWVTLAIIFLAAPIDYDCVRPENVTDACAADCEQVEFNRTIFKQNIIMEWNLICDRQILVSVAQMIVMFGIMTGGMLLGVLADTWGRRPVFVYACLVQLISGCLVSLAPWFWLFCLLRFICAFATGGMMVISFVIIMEIVGKSKRELMSILYQIPFNLGHATLPLFAYFLREWRWYHFGFSVFSTFYLVYFIVIPESPRWLFTTGRLDEAMPILEKGAKKNKQPIEGIRADLDAAYKRLTAVAPAKRSTIVDLFRYPYLRLKTLMLAFNWLSVCLVYYGVSQYITNFGGDIFVNVAAGAWLGIPGTIICVPMTKYLGRKFTLIASNVLSGVSLIAMACIPNINNTMQVVLATGGLFGASVTFPNVYMYSGELFPTVVRNSGMGLCSFVGRLGSMVAPYISSLSGFGLWIPALIFGIFAVLAALCTLILPETKGQLLPETIEDGENFGKKKKKNQAAQPAQL